MEFFEKDFGKILKANAQQMRHDLLPQGTNCFRVYDRNLSQFPVTVDLYGKYAKVTDYGEEGPLSAELLSSCVDICARMLYLEHENIIYSYRAKRTDREQHEKTEENSIETVVEENNLHFKVDLATYVDTGLFLDHRLTRMLIQERSQRADVLNLFSYTGSFSVYAAAGGANSVKSIDMSATYTKWAEENLAQNGFAGEAYQCICMDATKYVAQAIKQGEKYDIIIFDPPSFSNSRKMEGDFDVARDYAKWVKDLAKLLKKTGFILFSTNLGSFRMDKRLLRGLSVKEITGAVEAPGFVKGRKGTARSWMMALDDDSLKLDWSEPSEKKSEKGSDKKKDEKKTYEKKAYEKKSYEKKSYEKNSYDGSGDKRYSKENYRSRRSYEDKRDKPYGERSRKAYSEKSYGERDYEDRPYRERTERSSHYEGRNYEGRNYEGRSYEGRNYEGRDNRGNREYREYRDRNSDRPSYRSRLERNSERGGYDRYHSDRSDRRERNFDHERRDNERRDGYRSERSERSERPRYDRSDRNDRYDGASYKERSTGSRSSSTPYKGRDDKLAKSGKKPYGFDSFKPARSRDDSSDFFWNADDFDPKSDN